MVLESAVSFTMAFFHSLVLPATYLTLLGLDFMVMVVTFSTLTWKISSTALSISIGYAERVLFVVHIRYGSFGDDGRYYDIVCSFHCA